MRYPNKKAMEIMFNWIFVLIVGAMILMFFITIVGKQKSSAEQKESLIMLDNLDQMISLMKVSSDRQDVIEQRQTIKIEFYCDELVIGGISRDLGNTVMFAPKTMDTQTLFLMTKSWEIPFKVMNMLYVSTPEIKYYLIGDTVLAGQLKEMMMDNSEVEIIGDAGDIKHTGEPGAKLVFINNNNLQIFNDIRDLKDENVQAIALSSYGAGGVAPTVTFYRKRGNLASSLIKDDEEITSPTFTILDDKTLLGAIYSGSAEDYNCAMEKAKERFSYIADINKQRSYQLVKNNYGPTGDSIDSPCADYHNAAVEYFEELKRAAVLGTTVDMTKLNIQIQNLESTNEQAVLQSCARLY